MQMKFRTNEVNGDLSDGEFQVLPEGKYKAVITAATLTKPNAKGTIQLQLDWKVSEGDFEGKTFKSWFTYECPNGKKQAVEIGLRQIKNVCQSCGLVDTNDTDDFVGQEMVVSVTQAEKDSTKNVGEKFIVNELKMTYPIGTPLDDTDMEKSGAQSEPAKKPVQKPATAGTTARRVTPAAAPSGGTATPPAGGGAFPWNRGKAPGQK